MFSQDAIVSELRAAGCVFAEEEAQLLVDQAATSGELARLVGRRVAGYPLEQVLGWVDFCGLRLAIEPGVFVPRRRSELIVREAARVTTPRSVVVDLCCGCGALGRALAETVVGEGTVEYPTVYATDIEPAAVQNARRNLTPVGGTVFTGDLFEPLPEALRGEVDVVLCNAPYVPTAKIRTLPPEARLHEPRVTLDGGADGLDVVRRVVSEAARWLRTGGHVFVETSDAQAVLVAELFSHAGLVPRIAQSAEWEATAVVGRVAERPDRR